MEWWELIQQQVLGMQWLNELIGRGLTALGLDTASRAGGSIQFFLYDVLKITVLLCVLIFGISYIQSYFRRSGVGASWAASAGWGRTSFPPCWGTVTPFCSCSSIPLFIGFTSAGLPLGATFSFLISSPMVDLGSLVLLMSIFGAKVALIYVALGLVVAIVGGAVIENMHMEAYVEGFVRTAGRVEIDSPALDGAGTRRICQRADDGHLQKSVPVYPGRRRHRRADPQLDPGELGGGPCWAATIRSASSLPPSWVSPCTPIFSARSRSRRRCWPRGRSWARCCLYDGRHHFVAALAHHAAQGGQTQAAALFVGICAAGILLVGYCFNAIQFFCYKQEVRFYGTV